VGDAAVDGRRARRAQAAVIATFFVHGLLFASWTAHVPHVKAHLGVDDGTLGLALLGVPIGAVSAMACSAVLIPRFGSRVLVRVCLVGYCFAGPLVGVAGSVWGLFAALFLWGAFQGALDVSMNTQAITVEKRRGRPLMNGMHACWSMGAFAGAGIGTLSVAAGIELAPQLLVLGTAAVLAAGWLSTSLLLDLVEPPDSGSGEPAAGRRFSSAMLPLGAVAFASMLCEGAAADWSSIYLRDSAHGSAAEGGLGYTAFTLAMVAVRMLGNRLLDRFGAVRLLPALALVATVGFGTALAIGSVGAGIAGFFLLGLGVGSVVPTAFSAAGRLPGVHPGVGVAMVSGLGWAGFVCGPPIIGQLADVTSLRTALVLIPVLTTCIAAATTRSRTGRSAQRA